MKRTNTTATATRTRIVKALTPATINCFYNGSTDRNYDVEKVNAWYHEQTRKAYERIFDELDEQTRPAPVGKSDVEKRIERIKADIEQKRTERKKNGVKHAPAPVPVKAKKPAPVPVPVFPVNPFYGFTPETLLNVDTLKHYTFNVDGYNVKTRPVGMNFCYLPPVDIVRLYNAFPNDPDILRSFGARIVLSVLTTIENPVVTRKDGTKTQVNNYDPTLDKIRNEFLFALDLLDRTQELANDVSTRTNKNGDIVTTENNPRELRDVLQQNTGDGMDLLQVAVLGLLEERNEQEKREQGKPVDVCRPYVKRTLSKKVYIGIDSSAKWVEKETTPIQEVYKRVRRFIREMRSVRFDPENKFVYVDADIVGKDPDGKMVSDSIIYRVGKCADIGGYVVNANGASTLYTAGISTVENLDEITGKLELTKTQEKVLKYRMQGYGKKAISTLLGVDPSTVRDAMRAMQKKAEKAGFTPVYDKPDEKPVDPVIRKLYELKRIKNAEKGVERYDTTTKTGVISRIYAVSDELKKA